MKASDLRIGNLIYNGIGEVFPVNGETINNFNAGQAVLGVFKPIPLTEEWLIKMGFEKDYKLEELEENRLKQWGYGDIQYANFIRICYHETGKFTTSFHGTPLTKPKCVHQLQNLYHSLTGEELTIKETEKL